MGVQNLETSTKQEETKADGKSVESKKNNAGKKREAEYTVDELASAAEAAFKKRPELVKAALLENGKTKYTKAQAEAIVEKFAKREVN